MLRRQFVKALDTIAAYKKLYEIERELAEAGLDPDAVLAQRPNAASRSGTSWSRAGRERSGVTDQHQGLHSRVVGASPSLGRMNLSGRDRSVLRG